MSGGQRGQLGRETPPFLSPLLSRGAVYQPIGLSCDLEVGNVEGGGALESV